MFFEFCIKLVENDVKMAQLLHEYSVIENQKGISSLLLRFQRIFRNSERWHCYCNISDSLVGRFEKSKNLGKYIS